MTPMTLTLIYLSCTFLLGLALGWIVWNYGAAPEEENSEAEFWQERLERARFERDHSKDRIAALESEKAVLKSEKADLRKKLAAAKA